MKNKFYVIVEANGNFKHFDILPVLSREWSELKPKLKQEAIKNPKDWVDKELKYHFWSKCEYEVLLLSWPPRPNEEPEKIDVYWQISPNLELIVKLFSENEGLT